jgi:hypothetical protein
MVARIRSPVSPSAQLGPDRLSLRSSFGIGTAIRVFHAHGGDAGTLEVAPVRDGDEGYSVR